jgi:hypothetical protein
MFRDYLLWRKEHHPTALLFRGSEAITPRSRCGDGDRSLLHFTFRIL